MTVQDKKIEKYIKNPTTTSALPYYKTNNYSIPINVLVVKDMDFNDSLLADYDDEPYFKLSHNLQSVGEVTLPKHM